ncbi:uncharacterized protein PAC_05738 [Phialocephala subalpina]|uniref:Zn(2)-C6 fungal-type domain-containing protein n=1 Tax=Phialocephala subalpina TaxID=576137 RepID=A0A1L7WSU7_9HELO|nr:uncharacterized protein PAC_05738 [Phialocephala subalpina]
MAGPGNRKSKGCARCRSLKSKCDEQRPKCGRCRTADAPCEYRPDKPIDFKSMNSKIASRYKVTEPRKEKKDSVRRGKAGLPDNDGQAALTSNIKVQQASKGPPLFHSLSTHWEDPALCLFFQDYVLQADDAGFGFLDNFPKLYGTSSDEAFKNAVSAISLASFSNQVRCVDLGVAAKKSYGKALLSVKKALQDPSRSTSHATLASILTLNMYDMVCEDIPPKVLWGSHADALGMILRMRGGIDQFKSPISGATAQVAHGVVSCYNLDRRLPPGPESILWEKSVDAATCTPFEQIGLAYNRIARIIPAADTALSDLQMGQESAQRLLQAISMCQVEDRAYRSWVASTEHPFVYETLDKSLFDASKDDRAATLPPEIHVYPSVWAPGLWNTYRAARIVLLQTVSACIEKAARHPELAKKFFNSSIMQQSILIDIDKMVNEICSSIPYILGDIRGKTWAPKDAERVKAWGGFTSLWVLRVLIGVPALGPERKEFVIKQLHYIAGKMGIRQAGNIALIGYYT